MNLFFAKNGAVLNIWCFSSARIVSSMLDVDFLIFSQVERVSKQFHLPFWRVKNANEPWIKFQANIYNVLKLRFENPFHRRKSPDIPLFQLRSFGDLMHLVKLYPYIYHLTGFNWQYHWETGYVEAKYAFRYNIFGTSLICGIQSGCLILHWLK